jgi:hypothetical protein
MKVELLDWMKESIALTADAGDEIPDWLKEAIALHVDSQLETEPSLADLFAEADAIGARYED